MHILAPDFLLLAPNKESFDRDPAEVCRDLFNVLTGKDTSPLFARISTSSRRAIFEILRDTKKSLPDYWKAIP